MIVACGFDHAGVLLRGRLLPLIEYLGHQVLDLGTDSTEPIDYPDKALAVGRAVASGEAQRGVIVCGSGAGVSVAACKVRGIRATTVHDTYTAHQAVEHDDLNVLCLGARVIGAELAADIVTLFLGAVFSGEERHVRRLSKVAEIEATGTITTPRRRERAMSMRVVECNTCGEALAAATDDELVRRLRDHHESEHESSTPDEAAAHEIVANEAYDATDS
jgi:ribose 5-phosphate isomerase B